MDVNPENVRAYLKWHTHVEMRTEGPDQYIVILVGYDLLANYEQATSVFAPLCTASESVVLKAISDVELLRSISDMALWVSAFLFSLFLGFFLYLTPSLFCICFSH